MLKRIALASSLVILVTGCVRNEPAAQEKEQLANAIADRVKRARLAEMPSRSTIRDSMRVTEQPSSAVSGLGYQLGSFRPPGMFDARFTAVLGSANGRLRELRSLDDWNAIVRELDWTPSSDAQAASACVEILSILGPGSSNQPKAVVYQGPASLSDTSVLMADSASQVLRDSITLPSVQRIAADWNVKLWAIETERSVEYLCSLRTATSGGRRITSATLTPARTIRIGQLAAG